MHQQDTITSMARRRRRAKTRALLHAADQAPSTSAREAALQDAVVLNMEVARSLAAPYAGRGIDSEDLEQVAYAALTRAARDFDLKQADEFLAYAVPTVRGEVKKYFRDCGWAVRPPRRIQELQSAVAGARSRLQQSTGREPSAQEIADELGESRASVEEAMSADGCFTPTSLDRPVAEGTQTLGDLLADDESGFAAAEARLMLRSALRRLAKRDRLILQLRFYEGLTQQEIGEVIGVTQMQVSRLLSRILAQLREELLGSESQTA